MAGWQVALLVLAGVFVGMWIPVSLQLFATLRSGQRLLELTKTQGAETLAQLTDTAIGLKATLAEVEEVAHSVNELRGSLRVISSIGAAVGPAVVALIRALREPEPTEAPPGHGGAPPAEATGGPAPARPPSESTAPRREDQS